MGRAGLWRPIGGSSGDRTAQKQPRSCTEFLTETSPRPGRDTLRHRRGKRSIRGISGLFPSWFSVRLRGCFFVASPLHPEQIAELHEEIVGRSYKRLEIEPLERIGR